MIYLCSFVCFVGVVIFGIANMVNLIVKFKYKDCCVFEC
jgi:hypothetical protein